MNIVTNCGLLSVRIDEANTLGQGLSMNSLFWSDGNITVPSRKTLIVGTINKTHATILVLE